MTDSSLGFTVTRGRRRTFIDIVPAQNQLRLRGMSFVDPVVIRNPGNRPLVIVHCEFIGGLVARCSIRWPADEAVITKTMVSM